VSLQRITRIHVLIAGVAFGVGIALLFTVLFVRPQRKKVDQSTRRAAEAKAYAQKRPAVEEELERTKAQEAEITASYNEILENRMPKVDLSDPFGAWLRLLDLPAQEEQVIRKWFDSTGAQVTGYGFPAYSTALPGSFPNPNMRTLPPLSWNLVVQVKDFPELLEWLQKLPEAPRFMVLRSVSIQGAHQPGQPLTASVPVTLYEWTGVEPQEVAAAPAAQAGPAAAPATRRMGRGAGRGGRGRGGGASAGRGRRAGRGGRGLDM
jgi:type II secretory pathway component PulM